MFRAPHSDFWQVGIVRAPITALLDPTRFNESGRPGPLRDSVTWLPDPGPWRYLADPFGLQRDGHTHVFVEAFDYRTKHGVIEHHELGPDLAWRGKSVVLSGPFHLSYPYLIEEGGEVFMIPESHRAGEITLYRARRFPDQWIRETALSGLPGAEASVIRHEGRWWMFYTVVGPHARDQRELHVACADALTGPWKPHPLNPILDDRSGARPGGTPFVTCDGALILPVQDCSRTYGGAVRFLWLTLLNPEHVSIERLAPVLTGGLFSDSHPDGCHTLAKCGEHLTLIDTKRIEHSWIRYAVDLRRRVMRMGFAPAARRLAGA